MWIWEREKNGLIPQLLWWVAMDTWSTAGRWWLSFLCDNWTVHRSALQLWIMGNIGYTLVPREEICRDWWGIYPSVTPSFFQSEQIYSVTARYGILYHCFTEARRGSSEQRIPLLKPDVWNEADLQGCVWSPAAALWWVCGSKAVRAWGRSGHLHT